MYNPQFVLLAQRQRQEGSVKCCTVECRCRFVLEYQRISVFMCVNFVIFNDFTRIFQNWVHTQCLKYFNLIQESNQVEVLQLASWRSWSYLWFLILAEVMRFQFLWVSKRVSWWRSDLAEKASFLLHQGAPFSTIMYPDGREISWRSRRFTESSIKWIR